MLKKLIREYEQNHSPRLYHKIEELVAQGYDSELDEASQRKLERILR